MKLQEFIEVNIGKTLGRAEFMYEKIYVCTGITHPLEDWLVSVNVHVPGIDLWFSDVLDTRTLDSSQGIIVGFHSWLREKYIPSMKTSLVKYVLKKKDELI